MSGTFLLVVAVLWLAAAVAYVRLVSRRLRRAEKQLRRSNRFHAGFDPFDFPLTKRVRPDETRPDANNS